MQFADEVTYIGNEGRLGDRDNGWIFILIVEIKEGVNSTEGAQANPFALRGSNGEKG